MTWLCYHSEEELLSHDGLSYAQSQPSLPPKSVDCLSGVLSNMTPLPVWPRYSSYVTSTKSHLWDIYLHPPLLNFCYGRYHTIRLYCDVLRWAPWDQYSQMITIVPSRRYLSIMFQWVVRLCVRFREFLYMLSQLPIHTNCAKVYALAVIRTNVLHWYRPYKSCTY